MTLAHIDRHAPAWAALPQSQRIQIQSILHTLAAVPDRGITAYLRSAAPRLGLSYSTLRRHYDALRQTGGDWTQLIDRRSARTIHPAPIASTSLPAFRAELVRIAGQYQRNTRAAIRALHRRWAQRRDPIPGYADWPGWPALPAGWSPRRLYAILAAETDQARLRSLRVGTSSKTNPYLPHILTTRVHTWHQSIIQIDDVWHDNIVTLGSPPQPVRVIELGALDLHSACRFAWGAKPRRKTSQGTWETIRATDMRYFLASLLYNHGYSPRGTMFMSEHATAAIPDDIARTMYDATRGLLRVDYQPIEGRQAALTGYWPGSEGGNYRAKAALESIHNLIHNDLSALPMQTGSPSSGLPSPVTTDRITTYIQRTVATLTKRFPHLIPLLRLPTLDFYAQFIPLLTDYYTHGLNARSDHQLEGWETLGYIIREYTTLPGSDQWLSETDFLALPPASQAAIGSAAQTHPADWTRRRRLSPAEVWDLRPQSTPIPPVVICDILGTDLAREITCRRGFLEFADIEIAPDPLIYKAQYSSGPRAGQYISHGDTVQLFALPFEPRHALAVDAAGRYLGTLPLYQRVTPIDPTAFTTYAPYDERPDIRSTALKQAAGEKHSRIADILEPDRLLHATQVQAARDLRTHNRTLIQHGHTPAEHRSQTAQAAAKTRQLNRVRTTLTPTDLLTPDTTAPLDPFDPIDPFDPSQLLTQS